MSNGLFKGNASYFVRKTGTLEDIVSKINEANPKPEVYDIKKEANDYQMLVKKELEKKGKSLGDMSDQEKKDFFNGLDKKYKAKDEAHDSTAQKANDSQKAKDGEEKVKKTVAEVAKDMLLKAWKQAAQVAEEKHKEKKEMTDAQKKLPPALQKAIKDKESK
jgi:hypothetical protein